jgi:hypothetical protein
MLKGRIYNILFSYTERIFVALLCKKENCAIFIFCRICVILLCKMRTIPDLITSVRGRICDIWLFRTKQILWYFPVSCKVEFLICYFSVQGINCVIPLCSATTNPWFNNSGIRHNLWYFTFFVRSRIFFILIFRTKQNL